MAAAVLRRAVEAKTYLVAYLAAAIAVVSFSHVVAHLFGQTIPAVVLTFFRGAGEAVVLAAVFAFAFAWLLRARPRGRPAGYSVVAFDVFGREEAIDGLRTGFRTHDVAWSYMRQYKRAYPLHSFALVSSSPGDARRTIFRYI